MHGHARGSWAAELLQPHRQRDHSDEVGRIRIRRLNMLPTVFLSYARGDDEPFVAKLHAHLASCGFDVWFDRVSMPSRGLTFLNEIRDTINGRDRFILILGPMAVISDYVIAEWRHAITYGKAVTPILRLGDYNVVPDELKLLHVEDFRNDNQYSVHFEVLCRQLSEPVPRMGKLIGVPSLPPHLLSSKARVESLKDALLADLRRPEVLTGPAAQIGLHGMGGIGKSVLANLLVRDPEVRRAFPNGIVWVPISIGPDLRALQRQIAVALEEGASFAGIDSTTIGREKLRDVFASKSLLLVLDDVWRSGDVEAFDILGPRCRLIITTRDAGLITACGGKHYAVRELDDAAAFELLAAAAGIPSGSLPDRAQHVVAKCGRLPLALSLSGGMIRRGISWVSVEERLQAAALESIGDRHALDERHKNLWAAMRVSVDALNIDERARFFELAVFPHSEPVPEGAVGTLWAYTGSLDRFQIEDLLVSLAERSLIRLDKETAVASQKPGRGNEAYRLVSLHDMLHDYVTRAQTNPEDAHNKMVTSYLAISPYPARAGCATAAGSRRTRWAPPGRVPVFS
jgi:NB-ARC domain/TIR domain